jgi:hypothetical protein
MSTEEIAEIGVRLLDDAYLVWRNAEVECERMLETWRAASRGRSDGAYLAYQAALDREQAAAHDLERLAEVARPCYEVLLAPAVS